MQKIQKGGEKGYSGVILDIICLKDREQTIPDRDFLPIALMKVSKIAPNLPLAILTGESDKIEEHKSTYKAAAPVYLKGSDDVKDMLHYLKSEGNKLEENRVKDLHPEVFDIFSKGYLSSDVEQQLVDCFKNMTSRDYPTILNNLACLRRIQEEIII